MRNKTTGSGRRIPPRLVPNRELTIARLDKGWSANDFARVSGVSGNTIRAAEQGFYVDIRTQTAIAKALGFKSPLDLFPEDRQKEFQR